MAQHGRKRRGVCLQQRRERPLARPVGTPMRIATFDFQELGAQHGRDRERYHHGNGDRGRQRDGEFSKQAADDAAHHQQRNEHRNQGQTHRHDGEADFLRTFERRMQRRQAGLEVPGHILDDDDGIVHQEARRNGQGHERQVVHAVTQRIHHAESTDEGDRHHDRGNEGRAQTPQKYEHHENHQYDREDEGLLDFGDRGPDGHCLVLPDVYFDGLGSCRSKLRQKCLDPVDGGDDIRSRLPADVQVDPRLAVEVGRVARILDRIENIGDIREPDGGAAAIRDDEPPVLRSFEHLVVRGDAPRPVRIAEVAGRHVRICLAESEAHVLEADPVLVERTGIDFDPDARQRSAADIDLADAVYLRDLLLQESRGDIEHLPAIEHVRCQRQNHDRKVRRIHLPVVRAIGEILRQIARRRVHGGLDVPRGRIDIPIEIELQRDGSDAQKIGGSHLADARDASELPFQRRRDGRSHGLGTRSRKYRRHRDRRKVDFGQGRRRQQVEGQRPRYCDRDHQQRGRDRSSDEGRGEIQGAGRPSAAARTDTDAGRVRAKRSARRSNHR